MFKLETKFNFDSIENLYTRMKNRDYLKIFEKYAKKGVKALTKATPKDTGATAAAWSYKIEMGKDSTTVYWTNDNSPYGELVAALIEYGHATRSGTWVEGIDYINPAMDQILTDLTDEINAEVANYGR